MFLGHLQNWVVFSCAITELHCPAGGGKYSISFTWDWPEWRFSSHPFLKEAGIGVGVCSSGSSKKLEIRLPFQLGRGTPPRPQWLRCPFPLISFQPFLSSLSFGDTLREHQGSRMSFCLSSKHSPVVAILRFPSTSHMFEGLLHCD